MRSGDPDSSLQRRSTESKQRRNRKGILEGEGQRVTKSKAGKKKKKNLENKVPQKEGSRDGVADCPRLFQRDRDCWFPAPMAHSYLLLLFHGFSHPLLVSTCICIHTIYTHRHKHMSVKANRKKVSK